MAASRVIIKKYENRRLYDTGASRYINLDDVAHMVREGTDVQVLDARTGEDLTRVVLTQIIMEDAKGQGSGPPLELLRKLVVASDHATHEFLTWYLTSVTDMYQKAQSALSARPLEMVRNLFNSSPPPAPLAAPAEDIEALRRRVEDLEHRLRKATARQRKPQKPTQPG